MSLRRLTIACLLGVGVSAGSLVNVPSVAEPATQASDAKAQHDVRVQLQRERARAHRALSIRTLQVRRLRERNHFLARTLAWSPTSPISHLISVASAIWGVNEATLRRVVERESNFGRIPESQSATAVNPVSLAGEPAGACGIGQWIPSTYAKTAVAQAGFPCTDPVANTLQMIDWWSRGMASNWSPLPGPVR